ncbi:TRAP transporter substrate-binding protein [Lawsonibacter celer]|uniref:TRAP transporter substrate-binding protein n=1 Tax=Lawsonibacter celer TaxID=2986526 RepID=UPI0016466C30|nr:TRAP transporter substrate-binding protein [Lawsonibacter celer]
MKKRSFSILALVLAMVMSLAACGSSGNTPSGNKETSKPAPSSDGTVYEFNISHIASESDPIHMGWTLLKETLEEKSGGRIVVNIFGNKQLSNSNNEDAEKVQQNIVQATSVPTSSLYAMGNIKEYQVFDYPYLFENDDELYTVCDSDFMDGLSEKLASACGVRAYGGYNLGWCQISTNKGPINTPNDLFNQKIRTMSSDLQMAIVNSTGAGATIVNYGELFTACQQGTVDGMMTSTGLYVSDRFYECQKYMGVVHVIPLLHVPIVNNSWYEALPDDLKQIFDESMEIYLDGVRQYEKDFEAEALQNLAELGMEIREYTDEELQAFKGATSVVYTDYADVAGQETIDTVKSILGK